MLAALGIILARLLLVDDACEDTLLELLSLLATLEDELLTGVLDWLILPEEAGALPPPLLPQALRPRVVHARASAQITFALIIILLVFPGAVPALFY